ncbi:MAG: hypothetical protein K0Q73_209 [Paenibacillus sp.]|nr:hypothetical protein [Paenibacillus sp.]
MDNQPIWKEFRDLLVLGKENGLFKFESVELTLNFVISSRLMFKHWDFLESNLQDPGDDVDTLVGGVSKFVLGALHYWDCNVP